MAIAVTTASCASTPTNVPVRTFDRPQKVDVVAQAKEAGLVRLGIKKSNGNGDETITRV